MAKHFNKKFVITKEDDEDFENYTKCGICINVYADADVEIRDHCHISEKYRASAHRNCNMNVKLNY